MYIFELIAKLIKDHNDRKYNTDNSDLEDDISRCEHIYMAIDSTKDYLACTKCGNVIKNQHKQEKINIFKV